MREAEGITQKANEKAGAFPQFGAKQSGSELPILFIVHSSTLTT